MPTVAPASFKGRGLGEYQVIFPIVVFVIVVFGILVVYDFALVFALAPISLMFCPKFLPLPLPSILPI